MQKDIRVITWSVVAMCLLAAQCIAAGPSEHSWKAEWIGPAATSSPTLADASWIWTDEPNVDATRNAPAGARHFRRVIELDTHTPVVSANVILTADDRFKLSVNGQPVGKGDDWQKPVILDIRSALKAGRNEIVVQVDNDPPSGPINAAGLIARFRIERGDPDKAIEFATDERWQGSLDPKAGGWKPVRVVGKAGIAPWSDLTTRPAKGQENLWTCYRKTFQLDTQPARAIARIAVDSKYWLWVNGKLAVYEGGLKRGPNPRDTYFDLVDLAQYLKKGKNEIAVLSWYWGKDGFSHKSSGREGFLFELEAGQTTLCSDATWKVLRHPAYGETGKPHPNYRLSDANVHFDARADIGDWTQAGYSDERWSSPTAMGRPPVAPWNELIERPIPQWRTTDLLEYENANELPRISTDKPIIARLPRNITISPYLKIKAPAGLTIDMRTDNYHGGGDFNYRSEYITREGVQEFESLPYLNGHWVIYSIPAGVQVISLRYRESRYDTDWVGRFDCDDPFLNTLWVKALNTMNVNMRDSIQDPDRERAQWWGDAVILMNQIFYTCDARGTALVRKAIYNLVDWQKPDGVLYSPVPAGSWDKELPQQSLASIGEKGFWNYYIHTGDAATIEHVYPAVKRYLSLWQIGDDGLVIHRPGGWDWADWGENIDVPVIENAWLHQALSAGAKMARLTGNEQDARDYDAKRARIEASYNRAFWNGKEYRSANYRGETDERGHAMAVVFGTADPDKWPAIKTVFAQQFHCSPYMEKYVLESLFIMRDSDAAIARMKKRYQKMVESSYTTLWEGWGIGPEGFGGGTYNHGWSGGPLALMVEYIVGLSPTSPAYATYEIKPQIGPLNRVNTIVSTIKGEIRVEIAREGKQFTLKLHSPKGTRAKLGLPVRELLRINGKPANSAQDAVYKGRLDDREIVEVGPGDWTFSANE